MLYCCLGCLLLGRLLKRGMLCLSLVVLVLVQGLEAISGTWVAMCWGGFVVVMPGSFCFKLLVWMLGFGVLCVL